MGRRKPTDLVGEKFGKMTVTKELNRADSGGRRFLCQCDCGGIKIFTHASLYKPNLHCGCDQGEDRANVGDRFGKLTVVCREESKGGGQRYLFRCDCGVEKSLNFSPVKSGSTISCGCYRKRKGGLTNSKKKIHSMWSQMIGRCHDPEHQKYAGYGGKGVTVCDEWKGDEGFKAFVIWAESSGYEEGLDLDKDELSGEVKVYSPSTCQFISRSDNNVHRSKSENNKSSKYLGVKYLKTNGTKCWHAGLRYGKVMLLNKTYYTEKDAAIARDAFIKANNLPHPLNFY